jgi:hypothetical protein
LNWVLGLLSMAVFTSPDVTTLPQVTYLANRAQLAANACMVLIVMVVGILVMVHGSVQERYTLKELLPRMLVGFGAANMATPIVSVVIVGANTLTQALTGDRFTSQDSFNQIKRVVVDSSSDPAMFLVALVLQTLVLWMLVLLVITWIGRLAVLLVAAATAPIALMCHALPHTDVVARIWWRSLLGCLLVQMLQAITLHMAVATLLSSEANLPALGLPHDPTGLLNMLIACFLLWLVIRIPTWVARNFGGTASRGASRLGSIARVIVVQHVLGAVGLRGTRGLLSRSRSARMGLGARPLATHLHSHQHTNTHQHVHLHPPRGTRPSQHQPRRPTYYAGEATTTASRRPGRPPQALEGRPTLPSGPSPKAITGGS